MKKRNSILLGLALVVAGAILGILWSNYSPTISLTSDIESIKKLTDKKASFDEFSAAFDVIAREKGGGYAFELMRQAPLPFGLDMHLLGHVVGDILYEQEKIEGMKICTHDFRNACSHTIVIGALLEFGEGAYEDIKNACYAAPGGKGAYTMCFHGLGHGVLAFNDYDFPKTIEMCEEFSTEKYFGREGIECFGGAIMEIIGGGGHNREIWEAKRPEYLDPSDPFALCQADYLQDSHRPMCYNYMTPYAFEALGADMGYPDPAIYEQTFDFCAEIPLTDTASRDSCYGGLGKEFIGIATGRDFGLDSRPTKEQLSLMIDWCLLADETDGQESCIRSAQNSLYWGGERPYSISLDYCALLPNSTLQDKCFNQSIHNVDIYIDSIDYHQEFCAALPESYQSVCKEKFNLD